MNRLPPGPAPLRLRAPRLETRRLVLRAPRLGDAQDVYAYSRDPQVTRHVLWDPHRNIGETRAFLRALQRRNRSCWPGTFVMQERASGRVIGTIGFLWVDREHLCAEVGYSLARASWNRGYASEALIRLVRYAFEELGLNRIEGQHDVRNPASGAVMRHAGMRKEGVLRQKLRSRDGFMDVCLYAVLRGDWEAARNPREGQEPPPEKAP